MKTSEAGINLIKGFEGFRAQAYLCPGDVWTIGYGSTVGVKPGMQITESEASVRLREELASIYEKVVNRHVSVPLTQNQFDALVSFTYNLGESAFRHSMLLRRLNEGDYAAAAREFKRWNKSNGKVLKGLVKRRRQEAELFLKPVAQSRTVAGGVLAATSGAGSVAVDVMQDVIPAAQEAAYPLADTLEWMKYVLAGLTIAGALLAVYARIDDRRRKGV